jgi:anthraniloyl-CoA monooxygenase
MSNRSMWTSFVTVRCESWHSGNVVLLGDAAHTAHFTIGSGTKLAMEDSISLSNALIKYRDDLSAALTDYELERQPVVERFQEAATESATYFENVIRYGHFEPLQFAFHLLTRSGRITHLELEKRDPAFGAAVDRWFWSRSGDTSVEPLIAPQPALAPLRLRELELLGRVVLAPASEDSAEDGVPREEDRATLSRAAARASGLILAEGVAVSAHGRITVGSPGLYAQEHAGAWRDLLQRIRPASVGAVIGHAGRRGSTRPRSGGADRPLGRGRWPLLSASPMPYTPRSPKPHAVDDRRFREVREDFERAAHLAAEAGFDLLMLDCSHGYLLASFLSPLTNRRTDRFGGSLENRLRFPLEVIEAVWAAWPQGRPLAVRFSAADWASGGLPADEAIAIAAAFRDAGADLLHVVAGQTVAHDRPTYGRMYLVPYSDRVRNEVGVPTIASGNLTTADELNTVLAAGRADLCVLDPSRLEQKVARHPAP